jgi:hypothetical protein
MAKFYGAVRGQRGEATRLGGKKSGIETIAASWQGAVKVELYDRDGKDFARVSLMPWHGHGTNAIIYDGPVCPDQPPTEPVTA